MSREKDRDHEHLFRDEAGAALERAARLQEENSQLRAEIERLRHEAAPRNDRRDTPTVRTRRPTSQTVTATLFVLGTVVGALVALRVGMMPRAARPAPPEQAVDGPLRAPPVMMLGQRPLPAPTPTIIGASTPDDDLRGLEADLKPAPALDDCALLYYYDSANVKHYKAHCLNANAHGPR